MSTQNAKSADPLTRALTAVKQARAKLDAIKKEKHEPIAIVGMGCRMPGGCDTPEAFWSLLKDGINAVGPVPADRWQMDSFYHPDPLEPGKTTLKAGGFLENVDGFDARFFGISPREATRMDPQQRLLLQTAWEAVENAGIAMDKLRGSKTGVFVAINSNDYLQMQVSDPNNLDLYSIIGGANSIAANRISYAFDLRGPSLSVDTACSSSLVALHLAVKSLRDKECDMSFAAGVNLLLSPFTTMAHTKGLPIATDNHCKTFDASADGYVRGEGCGMLVLKRQSDAIRDGDPIWALIRGTAVNQDGRTNGLTAPNGLSQQDVIRDALKSGGVEAHQVSYVECHGTGTELGDPIEVEALLEVYGENRPKGSKLVLGSAKTNIGHLEAAAGMAGLLKAVLAIHHREIPQNLHFQTLNPHIPIAGSDFHVAQAHQNWQADNDQYFAAVSSFGAGGTNGHVILEQPASVTKPFEPAEGAFPLLLSAHTKGALKGLAQSFSKYLQETPVAYSDIAATAAQSRARHHVRLGLVAHSREDAARQLNAYLEDEMESGIAVAQQADAGCKTVFVFPGQGSQWFGMCRDLLESEAVFTETMALCEAAIFPHTNWSLMEKLLVGEEDKFLNSIDVVQPVLWAIEISMAALWRSKGIEPDAVIGHSMGESAAAVVAGALSLEDGARIICRRSKLMAKLSGQGVMVATALTLQEAHKLIEGHENLISVAVNNSQSSTVFSGDPKAMDQIISKLIERKVFYRQVKVDVASHSPQMDPLREELLSQLDELNPNTALIPMFSTVHNAYVDGNELNAQYWVDNLRSPVLFSSSVNQLLEDEHNVFIEMSPHPILMSAVEQNIELANVKAVTIASLRRDEKSAEVLLESMVALDAAGHDINWRPYFPDDYSRVRLPSLHWENKSFWLSKGGQRYRFSASNDPFNANASLDSALSHPSTQPLNEVDDVEDKKAFVAELEQARPDQRLERMCSFVAGHVADLLGFESADEVDQASGFFQIGMDSTLAVQLRRKLSATLGHPLPATIVFEYPNVSSLATYLATQLLKLALTQEVQAIAIQEPEGDWEGLIEETQSMDETELLDMIANELECFTEGEL